MSLSFLFSSCINLLDCDDITVTNVLILNMKTKTGSVIFYDGVVSPDYFNDTSYFSGQSYIFSLDLNTEKQTLILYRQNFTESDTITFYYDIAFDPVQPGCTPTPKIEINNIVSNFRSYELTEYIKETNQYEFDFIK